MNTDAVVVDDGGVGVSEAVDGGGLAAEGEVGVVGEGGGVGGTGEEVTVDAPVDGLVGVDGLVTDEDAGVRQDWLHLS